MELAMLFTSNDKTVRSDTVQDLKEFNSQSLWTRAKKQEQLVSMMPAFKKAFDLMGDDIVELATEIETSKNQTGDFDQKWLEESKATLFKQIVDEIRAHVIMSRMEKQMEQI